VVVGCVVVEEAELEGSALGDWVGGSVGNSKEVGLKVGEQVLIGDNEGKEGENSEGRCDEGAVDGKTQEEEEEEGSEEGEVLEGRRVGMKVGELIGCLDGCEVGNDSG
jgi:hypothetical protein